MSLPCGNYGSDPLLLYIMPEYGNGGVKEEKMITVFRRF